MRIAIIIFISLIFCLVACNQESTTTDKDAMSSKEEVSETEETIKVKSDKDIAQISPGKKLFILCAACHSLKKDEPHKVGPNLYAVFGKKAGLAEGFKYSEELLNSGVVWDKESMRAWIENPAEFVPGTSMAFIGIKDKEKQDLLIEYLLNETK